MLCPKIHARPRFTGQIPQVAAAALVLERRVPLMLAAHVGDGDRGVLDRGGCSHNS